MLKTTHLINMLKFFILLITFSVTAADITVPVGGSIQDAIDDVTSSGGGTVTLAAGTHTITTTLEMKSNVIFQGSGIYASTIKINKNEQLMAENGYSVGQTYAVNNVLIQNITFIGVNGDEGGVAITQQNTDNENITFLNVRCYNVGWGVHVKGAKNVLIENCDFSENGAYGKEGFAHNLYLRRVYGAVVKNCSFNNSITGNGINISYSEDVEVRDCEMIGNFFRGVRAAVSRGFLVHDCVIQDNIEIGIFANSETNGFTTTDIDWQDNCVSGSKDGIRASGGATGVVKNNNSFGNNDDYNVTSAVSQSGNVSNSSINCESSVEPVEPVEPEEPATVFVPDTNKLYHIDVPVHNVRLGASGESEDPYSTATTTTGANVEWKFVAKGNGSWHIQLASGSKPRLRTNNSADADMQAISSSGSWTYYDITEGSSAGTYFLTLPDAPADYKRLQIDNGGVVRMVEDTRNGTWESFTITELGGSTVEDVRMEAEDYDSMSGIQTEASTESGENVGWINNGDWLRFDNVDLSGLSNMDARIACNFSGGTIEVRTGSVTGALLGTISISNTGGNQNWQTTNTPISSVSGEKDVYLVFKGGSGYLFNVNWIEFNTSSRSSKEVTTLPTTEVDNVIIYPNPVDSVTTIQNAANTVLYVYDVNGSIIFTKVISSDSETINLGKLQTGIYYTEVIGSETHSVVKLVKN